MQKTNIIINLYIQLPQTQIKEIFDILFKGVGHCAKGRNGLTPIMFASEAICPHYEKDKTICAQRFIKNISYLLEKGALLNDNSDEGMNPLHLTSRVSNFSDLVLYFIDKGVNHKAKDKFVCLQITSKRIMY